MVIIEVQYVKVFYIVPSCLKEIKRFEKKGVKKNFRIRNMIGNRGFTFSTGCTVWA